MAVTAMKICSSTASCSGLCFAKGPFPWAVPQTDMAAIRNVAIAAPNVRKRMAAQITKGNARKAKASSLMRSPSGPPKIARHIATSPTSSDSGSMMWSVLKDLISPRRVRKNIGVMISTPMASPSHQTCHAVLKPDQAGTCVKRSVVAPIEAAIIGATAAPNAINPKTSRSRSKEGLSFTNRRTR